MERFMRMEGEQIQAAQMHSMAADELTPLVPAVSDIDDMKGEPWSQHVCFVNNSLYVITPEESCPSTTGPRGAPNMHSSLCL